MTGDGHRWNHNIHYHRMLLRAVPPQATHALDVGCGEGMLARALRAVVPHVAAIDLDVPSIQLARSTDASTDINFIVGDFMTHFFDAESFDVVTSVATLHHMDAVGALTRMRGLLRPGGTLAVLGLARSQLPADALYEAAAVAANLPHRLTKTYWEHSAPQVWPPPETWVRMRLIAETVLPGVRFRRHALWRYSIVWTKPGTTAEPA